MMPIQSFSVDDMKEYGAGKTPEVIDTKSQVLLGFFQSNDKK